LATALRANLRRRKELDRSRETMDDVTQPPTVEKAKPE
jgi:hypothetical protein